MTAASAYPPRSPEPADTRPPEPSMEDILASIRRIIADDQNQTPGSTAHADGARRQVNAPQDGDRALARARTPYDDVLDLAKLSPAADREAVGSDGQGALPAVHEADGALQRSLGTGRFAPYGDAVEASPEINLRARLPEPVSRGQGEGGDREMLDHVASTTDDEVDGDLLSAPLGESVLSAFETLAATVVLQNTPMLERVMRDLLRPMLKTWLDDNLPGLVERLVRAEIERVARGSRG